MKNVFTIDVEDYFQVEALSSVIAPDNWSKYKCRVEKNTHTILDLLAERKQKGTFFVLGWIAKRYPELVRAIAAHGHEIASHGMSHQLIYGQSKEVFRKETIDSKHLLEDISQHKIEGYRAATYSITNDSLWALDILIEAGFVYDSSIFPMRHDKYGIADIFPKPHRIKSPSGASIVEFPISTLKKFGFTLPIAGGGYFRLFPYWFTQWGLKNVNSQNEPFVFYLHPWEVDPKQPKVTGISWFSKFRHYNNLEHCQDRLVRLLDDFEFQTMKECLVQKGLLEEETLSL